MLTLILMTILGSALALGTLYIGGMLIWYLLLALGRWQMFEKMGQPGWKGFITIIDESINKLNGLLTNRGGAAYLMGYAALPLFAFSRPCTSVAFCNQRARTRK
ncbi:MAG: hypothetical protein E7422_05885 [Ruminococcaceae bacterium]|nr:hypothetical protein [Oscillospiraceae bacterium]